MYIQGVTLFLAHVGGIFALLTLVHFAADWIFQSHAEAMIKHKNHRIRAKHCVIYTGLCLATIWPMFRPSGWMLLVMGWILFISHFLEDTYLPVFVWARYIRRPMEMEAQATQAEFGAFASTAIGKILLIALDQIVHIFFLVPVAVICLNLEYVGVAMFLGALVMPFIVGMLCFLGSLHAK